MTAIKSHSPYILSGQDGHCAVHLDTTVLPGAKLSMS